jgi:hypothetical protein
MKAAADPDETEAVRKRRVEERDGNQIIQGKKRSPRHALDHGIEGSARIGDLVERLVEADIARLQPERDHVMLNRGWK